MTKDNEINKILDRAEKYRKPPEYSPLDYPPQNIIKILTFL